MRLDTIKKLLLVTVLATVLVITSCGGGSSTTPGSPPPPPPPPPATTVVITPAAVTVHAGATQPFMAQVSGPKDQTVTWSVAGGGTITSAGLYTAPSTTGVDNVVATSAADPKSSATATVVVTGFSAVFSPTGNLQKGREFHTAALLGNGKTLVAGGAFQDGYCLAGIASAELYDPAAGSFASTGDMTIGRYAQTSTLLPDGKVLITGGFSSVSDCPNAGITPALISAELYDPSQGSFALTGSMAETRGGQTATLLTNGKVLITGGTDTGGGQPPFYFGNGSATAELYDPASGQFTSTGNMTAPRVGQTATLLGNGKVLIAGGWTTSSPIASAELYDPGTGTFSPAGSMTSARAGHTATLLPDSTVLITGGQTSSASNSASNTAEVYDPATGSFLLFAYMAVAREAHTATLLPNGTVLVVGGGSIVAEIYIPYGYFLPVGITESIRSGNSATLLQNGSVIVIGGIGGQGTAELYH